jgi:hypothetical protein
MNETLKMIARPCSKCGEIVKEDWRFCKYCGFELSNSSGANQTAQTTEIKQNSAKKDPLFVFVVVMLVVAGISGFVIVLIAGKNTRSVVENVNSDPTAAPATSVLTLSAKAQQAEQKILRGEALTTSDLVGIQTPELRLLRNAHFARYGRKYTTPELNNYLQSRSWYKPSDSYNDNMLTSTDKDNVKLILSIEKPETAGSNSSQDNSSSNSSPDTESSSTSSSSLETVALQKGKDHFEQYFTKCGSNYIVGNPGVREIYWYRDVTFSVERQSDAETDRLNEVEFNGRLLASARFKRNSWGGNDGRGGYRDWQPFNTAFAGVRLTKRKGQDWDVAISNSLLYRKIQCSEIPSGIPQ